MATSSSLFKGIQGASSVGKGDYLSTGVHRLKLLRAFVKHTKVGKDGIIFNVEVLESSNPKYGKGTQSTIYIEPRPLVNWLGDVKNVVMACCGSRIGEAVAEDYVDEETMEGVMGGEGTLLAGAIFKCNAYEIMTKRNTPFTKYACEPIF